MERRNRDRAHAGARRRWAALWLLATINGGACAAEGEVGDPEATLVGVESARLDFDPDRLASGQSRVVVGSITAAENQLFTGDGRLFLSADAGLFEIVQDGGGYAARMLYDGAACRFGGLTELLGTLYANCYDGTDSQLFAASLTARPEPRSIHRMPGVALANGLTTDGEDRLFVAATLLGQVLQLQLSEEDPFVVASQNVYVPNAGSFANGLKFARGALFWSDFGTIKSARVRRDGAAGPIRTVASGLEFFDDLYVDGADVVTAGFLSGAIHVFDRFGTYLGGTRPGVFNGPSSVLPARGQLGLPADALLVTERNGNQLSVFVP